MSAKSMDYDKGGTQKDIYTESELYNLSLLERSLRLGYIGYLVPNIIAIAKKID